MKSFIKGAYYLCTLTRESFNRIAVCQFPIKFDTFEQLKMRIGSNNWDVEIYGEKLENMF